MENLPLICLPSFHLSAVQFSCACHVIQSISPSSVLCDFGDPIVPKRALLSTCQPTLQTTVLPTVRYHPQRRRKGRPPTTNREYANVPCILPIGVQKTTLPVDLRQQAGLFANLVGGQTISVAGPPHLTFSKSLAGIT